MKESTLIELSVGQHFSLSKSQTIWKVELKTSTLLKAVKKDSEKVRRTFVFNRQYQGRKYFGACHGDRPVILHSL